MINKLAEFCIMKLEPPVIFFDGFCNLCSATVQFTIERDHNAVFRFASLQGEYAQEKLALFNIEPNQSNSLILIENNKVYQRSTAALKVARRLNGLWPLLYSFIILPRFIRDAVYNYVAKNRYKWYGKKESCWLPTAELKGRFL